MLEDSTQRTFFEVLEAEDIGFDFNKQKNRLRFTANGSEILFATMENPERLRGPNLAWFALDELTYTREEAWTRLLGRLRHPRAHRLCGCAVWTPKGYDWCITLPGAAESRLSSGPGHAQRKCSPAGRLL